ncbi:hypothetical protein A0H76_3033 [Hepatospora eriocheir]|uniref:Uncharacterized protein n=1 Tax=Hepatospora eriocheir TaxID=1081669 RepID=A0A1X0QHF5_9MICR|nr:hypothetical protein HERIO_2780 [Hepatospora eriocheir]ORD99202.1 hypothetical protein A0H76_3033 [Hepatospora eriocheir]
MLFLSCCLLMFSPNISWFGVHLRLEWYVMIKTDSSYQIA